MIKIDYKAVALQSVHTGSDENSGTVKKLRREKIKLAEPLAFESSFSSENERREAVVFIYNAIWRKIDFTDMKSSRTFKIWDEFSGKVKAASHSRTIAEFINRITEAFDIKALKNIRMLEMIEKFSDDEFLTIVRDEHQLLILLLRRHREEKKNEIEEGINPAGNDFYDADIAPVKSEKKAVKDESPLVFRKTFDWVPVISGNSIRGILRRLCMKDFCVTAGIEKLNKKTYHMLFTGGMLDGSTRYEEIAEKEKLIEMCPFIGLFGCAAGNQMIAGHMTVGAMRPICIEHGNGDVSFYELLAEEFGVRFDSAKIERDLEIVDVGKKEKLTTHQMKYGHEVLIKGTELIGNFGCFSSDKLIISAFYYMLRLFKLNQCVGGLSGTGHGGLNIDHRVVPEDIVFYTDYVEKNKEKIREYFKV